MAYPEIPDLKQLTEQITAYTQLQHERGAGRMEPLLRSAQQTLRKVLRQIQQCPVDAKMAQREPNDLRAIRALRPKGPRKMWAQLPVPEYREKLAGAMLGRFAGCTLGAPVEFNQINTMQDLAKEVGDVFPPVDYWSDVPNRHGIQYHFSRHNGFVRSEMDGIPVDDDIMYTLLGLLVVEKYGLDFTTEENGEAWLQYLPFACTAEDVALKNLKKKIPAKKGAEINNPYCEWIGADIRSDPWAYMAPGWPERAAGMAYCDAYLSHRRQGIYGEMLFSAAISAAFAVKHPVEAIEIGLTEIPRACALAKAVRWALNVSPKIKDYQQARDAVNKRFKGMPSAHTINNACLTIWGLTIGGTDFTKVIGETVAMGLDNDCTAATAGSICGAVVGRKGIPPRWTRRFNNKVHSYLIKQEKFAIDDLLRRFEKQARCAYAKQ